MSILGDWVFVLAALAVLVVFASLVYMAWWALFADRSRNRRRCPRCWYDMAYTPGMTCGECGFVASNEMQFYRTRRRYGLAAGVILASVAIALFLSGRMTQRSLLAMVPSRVLIWTLPLTESPQSSTYAALITRLRLGQLSTDQVADFLDRCASGDWKAQPVTDEWIAKYGDFIISMRHTLVDQSSLEQKLQDIPPRIDLSTRDTWPVGMPVSLGVQARDWWPWGTECRLRIAPRIDGVKPVVVRRASDGRLLRSPFIMELPPLSETVRQITVDVSIERRRLPRTPAGQIDWEPDQPHDTPWEPVLTQTLTINTRAEGSIDQVAQPTAEAAMTQGVMQAFGGGVVKWADGRSPVRFNISTPATFSTAFNDTAIGVRAELVFQGEVARRLHLWWIAGAAPALGGNNNMEKRGYGFEVDYENVELLRQLQPEDDRWTLRVQSDRALAMRAGAAKKFWEGEFEQTIRVRTRRDDAPPRPWQVEQ